MRAPRRPPNEVARLTALHEYQILDTDMEGAFDGLTKLAARILGVPIALVSIVDSDRQWFKSRYGLEASQTPRDVSFCGHVVEANAPLVVADATEDERFRDNPLVIGEPRVRFYAGMPLRSREGFVLGTLCAIDHAPRRVSGEQLALLEILAGQVCELLELRRTALLLAKAREMARRTEQKLQKIIDNVPALVGYWDADRRNVFANRAYADWFGMTAAKIRGRHIRDVLGDELYAKNLPFLERALNGEEQHFQRTIPTPTGTRQSAASYVPDWDGDAVCGIFVLVTDVTELEDARTKLKRYSHHLEELAWTDELTKLLNRRAGEEFAEKERARAAVKSERLFVAILDVDHFKTINDTYGHSMGDEVLRHMGRVLHDSVRGRDVCARWGGEEFFLLLSGTDGEGARAVVERIRSDVAKPEANLPAFTVSVGLAEWRPGKESLAEAMATADARLYAAKSCGRNRVVFEG